MEDCLDDALEAFIRAEQPRLVASLVLLVGDVPSAEDLAQGALLRLIANWPRVARLQSPAGWLHGVALNLTRSRWRRVTTARRAEPRLSSAAVAISVDVDEMLDLHAELATLPRRQREALVIRHVIGLDPEETASVLGCSAQAVRNLTNRGAATLRERLTPAAEEVTPT